MNHSRRWGFYCAKISRRTLSMLWAAIIVSPGLSAHGANEAVLVTGDSAPGLPGLTVGSLPQSFFPDLTNSGQLNVQFSLAGTGVTTANDGALWVGTTGSLNLVLREGQAATGEGSGVIFDSFLVSDMNDSLQISFSATLTGTGVTDANNKSLWRMQTDGAVARLARENDTVIGGGGARYGDVSFGASQINSTGTVFSTATLTGTGVTTANDRAAISGTPGQMSQLIREGQIAPVIGGGVLIGDIILINSTNDVGEAGFRLDLTGTGVTTGNNNALYAGSRTALTLVAREGSQAPGQSAGVNYASFDFGSFPRINNVGQVAFLTLLTGTGVTTSNDRAIYAGPYDNVSVVVREGDAAPGAGAGVTFSDLGSVSLINDSGVLAFTSALAGTGVTTINDEAAWVGAAGNLRMIARKGSAAPGLPSGVTIGDIVNVVPNSKLQVGFQANLVGEGFSSTDRGYWLTDGTGEVVLVMHDDQVINGRTVQNSSQSLPNDHGQVASRVTFTNGDQGVFLFTPDLRWRSGGSGNWDTAGNWTLSLNPAHVHAVTIDPSTNVTVTGPAQSTTVKALGIGGGFGNATLRTVSEGQLEVLGLLSVNAGGTLDHRAGGIRGRFLTNTGNVDIASSMNMSGGIVNTGSFDVAAAGFLSFQGTFRNSRTVTITDGTVRGEEFLNEPGATVQARGQLSGRVVNRGTFDLLGPLFSDDILNQGSLRLGSGDILTVSNGSTDENQGLIEFTGGAYTSFTFEASAGTPLMNKSTGIIRGFGTLGQIALTNDGGVIHATGGTLHITLLTGGNINGGELRIDDEATLTVGSSFSSAGTIVLRGADATLSGGALTNTGSLSGRGRVANNVLNSGEIRADEGRLTLTASGNTNVASGQIVAEQGAEVFYSQGLASNAGQIVLLGGSFHNNGKLLANNGLIEGHGTLRTGGLTITSRASITVGGGDLNVLGNVTNSGLVTAQTGRTIRFFNDVQGAGSFGGKGTVEFLASFSPGNSPGLVEFSGDLVLHDSSSLVMELAGQAPGTEYDRINVDGMMTLGGTLEVRLLDGFEPRVGDRFEFLDGAVSGRFSFVILPQLSEGLWWDTAGVSGGVLSVVPEPSLLMPGAALALLWMRRRPQC